MIIKHVIKDGSGKVVHSHVRGLGDAVAKVAKPIARVIDRVAGTNLENCKPCHERQDWLNQAVPFKK